MKPGSIYREGKTKINRKGKNLPKLNLREKIDMNSEDEKLDQVSPDTSVLSSTVSQRSNRWLENEELKLLRETVERQRKIISEQNATISEQRETIVSITLENERRTQILIRSLKRTHQFVDLLARFDDLLTAQKADQAQNMANKRENPMEPKNIEVKVVAPMELEILVAENSEQENVPKVGPKPFTKPLESILIEKSIKQKSIREKSLPKPDFSEPPKGSVTPEFDSQNEEKSDIRKSPDLEKMNRPNTRKRSKSIESKEPEKSMLEKSKLEKMKLEKSNLEKSKAKPIKEKSRPKKSKLKIKDVTIIDDRILQVEAAAYERENMKVETESEDDYVEIHLPPKKKRKVNRRFGIQN